MNMCNTCPCPPPFAKGGRERGWETPPSAVEGIRYPLPMASTCINLPPSKFTPHPPTLPLFGRRMSLNRHIPLTLSTGCEHPEIKYLYLIWIVRTGFQLLSVDAADGQRNCVSFPNPSPALLLGWTPAQQWGTAIDTPPVAPWSWPGCLPACSFTSSALGFPGILPTREGLSPGKDCEAVRASLTACLPQGHREGTC